MEYNQYISPDGVTYNFDNQVDFFMESIAGTGMPSINPVIYDIAQFHGKQRVGYRLEPRTIKLIHTTLAGCTRALYYSTRATILDTLRPNRTLTEQPGKLRKIFADGTTYDLDVFITGSLTLDEDKPISTGAWVWKDVIEFTAYNPIYYNATLITETLSIQGIEEIVFPIDFPVTFGGNIIEATKVITYNGTWETWPTIVITGPVQSPKITNTTSGKSITVSYKVSAGEVVTINTDPFNMSVVNDNGDNLAGHCGGSDLTTFNLLTAPYEDNTITFSGGAKFTSATCGIKYYSRYIGY